MGGPGVSGKQEDKGGAQFCPSTVAHFKVMGVPQGLLAHCHGIFCSAQDTCGILSLVCRLKEGHRFLRTVARTFAWSLRHRQKQLFCHRVCLVNVMGMLRDVQQAAHTEELLLRAEPSVTWGTKWSPNEPLRERRSRGVRATPSKLSAAWGCGKVMR